jgi:putative ABC transport system ATP-binding protein
VSISPLIALNNIAFDYADPASRFSLRVPSLEIASGERVALIGGSGCGKTTLALLLAGIHTPASGEILVDGTPVHCLREAERRRFRIARIGFIFQEFELLDYLRADDNILLPYRINPALKLDRAVDERLASLTKRLGLAPEKLRRYPARLSQGERQRVAIARALINEPRILIADEPTGNLDPANAAAVMNLIESEAARLDATFLMITHDHSLLSRFDRTLDVETYSSSVASSAS